MVPMKPPLFDFARPIGYPCPKCGYPFGNPLGKKFYPLDFNDCQDHMPPWWKYHERKAYEEAMGGKDGKTR